MSIKIKNIILSGLKFRFKKQSVNKINTEFTFKHIEIVFFIRTATHTKNPR